jgi:hypothetical protein
VNLLADVELEVYCEYRTTSGSYVETEKKTFPGGTPIEVVISGLTPNTKYFYRVRYRERGEPEFSQGEEHSFHTQRVPGSTFTFTVQSDPHAISGSKAKKLELYQTMMLNAVANSPDFHFDLGDTSYSGNAVDYAQALDYCIAHRPYFGLLCHSAPLFLVLGNHDGELGWNLDGTANNVAVWATNARKLVYPNPCPDGFYTGSATNEAFVGLRENYYAWEWGDALFVVLDPFWYTTTRVHNPRKGGSGDNWDWTLGYDQYSWLKQTLEQSDARFKFVFSHHMTGGVNTYGRGGVEAAEYYEWGGKNEDGTPGFYERRQGWGEPIHQLMVENGVSIYFHGHDHVFVKQELDGIIYQECPQPNKSSYNDGFASYYVFGDVVNNSGHLRVTVSESEVTVDYVRAYLPGDGINGEVAYTYTITADVGCESDDDCHDDGLFCNGLETCVDNTCQAGTDPCPGQTCDEDSDTCVDCLVDGDCDDSFYCNGAETCVDGNCRPGTADPCPEGQTCDEDSDTCCTLSEQACDDGIDNDCDALTDCSDTDCAGDPACGVVCGSRGDPCTDDEDCCSNKCRKRRNKCR